MLKGVLLSMTLLTTCTFGSPARAATAEYQQNKTMLQNLSTEELLPLDTPLLFRGYDYNNQFLGYLGLTSSKDWDGHAWDYLYMDAYRPLYLEDAGNNKVYMRSGKPNCSRHNYVVISSRGYLYLGGKEYAEAFITYEQSDPIFPQQKRYRFFDRHYRPIGIYGKYITAGLGTTPATWKIIKQP